MGRESFNTLTVLIQHDPICQNNSKNLQNQFQIQLATTFYFLGASGVSSVQGAARLGIGEGTTCLYCDRSISALIHLLPHSLAWPRSGSSRFQEMRIGEERTSGFSESVGFLNGTAIVQQRSLSYHGEIYFNSKKQYSLNIQEICDSTQRCILVSGGYLASVGDTTVFSGTLFFQQPNLFFSHPE